MLAGAAYNDKGRHILADTGMATDIRIGPDAGELMYGDKAAYNSMVFNLDMSSQGGAIGQDGRITDHTIMGNMRTAHEEIAGAYSCNTSVRNRTAVDGDIFPYLVIVTDNKFRILALVFQILGRGANGGKGADNISCADGCGAGYNRMRLDNCVPPDAYSLFDNHIGTDIDGTVKLGPGINDCCWMYMHFLSREYEDWEKNLDKCRHKFGLGNYLAVDRGLACHLPDFPFVLDNGHFKD